MDSAVGRVHDASCQLVFFSFIFFFDIYIYKTKLVGRKQSRKIKQKSGAEFSTAFIPRDDARGSEFLCERRIFRVFRFVAGAATGTAVSAPRSIDKTGKAVVVAGGRAAFYRVNTRYHHGPETANNKTSSSSVSTPAAAPVIRWVYANKRL